MHLKLLGSVVVAIVASTACAADADLPLAQTSDDLVIAEPAATPAATPPRDTAATATEPDPPPEPVEPAEGPVEVARDVELVGAIRLVEVTDGLQDITNLTNAGDDRLFVTTQPGQIRVLRNGQLVDEPFLDIENLTDVNSTERGLLDVAFHPEYASNGFFYINYTDLDGDTVVSRFEVSSEADRADPGSEKVILQVDQPRRNHNGGQIEFGPDGYLYIAMGDGGGSGDPEGNGQDTSTLHGAILRIDVDVSGEAYAIPEDNPFVGAEDVRDEIWAYGVRNPWGLSFDSETGDLWFGDVGQDDWEEVNRQPAGIGGQNYGWNTQEGFECFRGDECDTIGLTEPTLAHSHNAGRCSVTGGLVYRGDLYPEMYGNYFYGDFCRGSISTVVLRDSGLSTGDSPDQDISTSAFGVDIAGNLYVADRLDDILFRIEPAN